MKASRITSTTLVVLLLGFVVPAFAGQERPSDKQDHPKQENARPEAKPAQQHEQQPARASAPKQQPARASAPKQQPERQQPRANATPQRAEQERPAPRQSSQPEKASRPASRPTSQPTSQPGKAEQPRQASQRQAPQQQQQAVSRQQEHARQQRSAVPAQQNVQQSQGRGGVQQSAWQQHRAGNWQSDHRTWQQRGGYRGYRIPDDRFRGYFGPDHGFRIRGLPFMVVGGYPRFEYDGYWLSVVDPWPADWGNDWYDNDQVYVAYVDNGYYLYNRSYPGVGIAVSISM